MKGKIIGWIIIAFFFIIPSYADLWIEDTTPYEDRCAEEIITDKSQKKFDACVKKCIDDEEDFPVYCGSNCGWWPEICIETNGERMERLKNGGKLETQSIQNDIEKWSVSIFHLSSLLILLFLFVLWGGLYRGGLYIRKKSKNAQ